MEAKLPQQISLLRTHVSAGPTNTPNVRSNMKEDDFEAIRRSVALKHHEFAWRCTAISCIVEYLAYQADSEVFKVIEETDIAGKDILTQERQDARDYIDKYVSRVCESIDSSEEFMADFRMKLSSLFKRKLSAARNAITKQAKGLGVEQHLEAISALALTMKFIEIQIQCHKMINQAEWYAYVRKNTPIERGLPFAELAYKHYSKVLGMIDPYEHKKPQHNKNIEKLFNDLIKMIMDTSLYVKAVNYALKENKDE